MVLWHAGMGPRHCRAAACLGCGASHRSATSACRRRRPRPCPRPQRWRRCCDPPGFSHAPQPVVPAGECAEAIHASSCKEVDAGKGRLAECVSGLISAMEAAEERGSEEAGERLRGKGPRAWLASPAWLQPSATAVAGPALEAVAIGGARAASPGACGRALRSARDAAPPHLQWPWMMTALRMFTSSTSSAARTSMPTFRSVSAPPCFLSTASILAPFGPPIAGRASPRRRGCSSVQWAPRCRGLPAARGPALTPPPHPLPIVAPPALPRPPATACKADAQALCNSTWFFGPAQGKIINCLRCAREALRRWPTQPPISSVGATPLSSHGPLLLHLSRPRTPPPPDLPCAPRPWPRESKDQVSAPCRAQVAKVQAAAARDYRADPGMHEACEADAQKLCKDVKPGGGRVQGCLVRGAR
jgi:hypothetical protein